MIPDGTYTAVVDRIEDGLATLQVEHDDGPSELVVSPDELPEPARREGAVLRVELADGELADVTYDPAESEARRDDAQERFDRLSKRPSRDGESETAGADESGPARDDPSEPTGDDPSDPDREE